MGQPRGRAPLIYFLTPCIHIYELLLFLSIAADQTYRVIALRLNGVGVEWRGWGQSDQWMLRDAPFHHRLFVYINIPPEPGGGASQRCPAAPVIRDEEPSGRYANTPLIRLSGQRSVHHAAAQAHLSAAIIKAMIFPNAIKSKAGGGVTRPYSDQSQSAPYIIGR